MVEQKSKSLFGWRATKYEREADSITIELRNPKNNGWAVLASGQRLGRHGKWDYEPLPSSRTDAWIDQFTFNSLQEAKEAVERFVDE